MGGGKTNTQIMISDYDKVVKKGDNNFYGIKYMLKRNYADIKNMIYSSQYNLKYKKQRMQYFYRRIVKWLV